MIREKFKKAQAERIGKWKKKELIDHDLDSDLEPFPQPSLAEANKTIKLREELKNVFRQSRVDKNNWKRK